MTNGANTSMPKRLQDLKKLTMRIEETIAIIAMIGIVLLLAFQVISRYVFDSPFPWTEELSRFTFVWLIYIGAAFLAATNSHLAVTFISDLVSPTVRRNFVRVTAFLVLIAAAAIAIGGIGFTINAFELAAPGSGLAMGLVYLAPLLGFSLIAVHSIEYMITGEEAAPGQQEIEATV